MREDYITNIHAYWRHSQKAVSTNPAAGTLPPKSKPSKSSAAYGYHGYPSSQHHGAYDQSVNDLDDHQNYNDDVDDNNPRHKEKSRQSQNEWDHEYHKTTRHKGKKHADDDQWHESLEDYYDTEDYDYYDDPY